LKKKDLIKEIEEAIDTEETATTIFLGHIKAFSERLPLDDNFFRRFKKMLEYLITQNKKHKELMQKTLQQVKKDKRDVY